jgi:hypothetical protein
LAKGRVGRPTRPNHSNVKYVSKVVAATALLLPWYPPHAWRTVATKWQEQRESTGVTCSGGVRTRVGLRARPSRGPTLKVLLGLFRSFCLHSRPHPGSCLAVPAMAVERVLIKAHTGGQPHAHVRLWSAWGAGRTNLPKPLLCTQHTHSMLQCRERKSCWCGHTASVRAVTRRDVVSPARATRCECPALAVGY